jgi:hypothetical protein
MRHKNLTVFNFRYFSKHLGWGSALRSVDGFFHDILLTIEHWTAKHSAFILNLVSRMAILSLQHENKTVAPEHPKI